MRVIATDRRRSFKICRRTGCKKQIFVSSVVCFDFFQPNIAGSVPATLNKLEQVDEPGSGKHVEYLFLQTFDIKVAMVGCALLIDSHQ
jgi:hypothetical protein